MRNHVVVQFTIVFAAACQIIRWRGGRRRPAARGPDAFRLEVLRLDQHVLEPRLDRGRAGAWRGAERRQQAVAPQPELRTAAAAQGVWQR